MGQIGEYDTATDISCPPEQTFRLHKRPTPERGTAEGCVKDFLSLAGSGA
jgi:hypothetical protein